MFMLTLRQSFSCQVPLLDSFVDFFSRRTILLLKRCSFTAYLS